MTISTSIKAGVEPTRRQVQVNRRPLAGLAAILAVTAATVWIPSPLNIAAIVAVFFSSLALGWCLAASAVTLLSARRTTLLLPKLPTDFHALTELQVHVGLANPKRLVPTLFATVNFRTDSAEHALWSVPQTLVGIAAGRQARLTWGLLVRKRGPLAIGPFVARIGFPGSLLHVGLIFDYTRELVALPAEYELVPDVLAVLAGRRETVGRNSPVPSGMGDFAGVREWRPGDPSRLIHPTLSLRAPGYPQQFVVREFDNPASNDILVVLDSTVPDANPMRDALAWRFEKAICFVSALCKLLVEHKYRVCFLTCGDGPGRIRIPLGPRREDLGKLQRALAHLAPTQERSGIWKLVDSEAVRTGPVILYVTLRKKAEDDRNARLSVLTITPDSIAPLTKRVVQS